MLIKEQLFTYDESHFLDLRISGFLFSSTFIKSVSWVYGCARHAQKDQKGLLERSCRKEGEEMIKGLTQLSKTIGQLNPSRLTEHNPIPIVAAGGAISVLILKNRDATRDIDYFTFDPIAITEITTAKEACASAPALRALPDSWINAEMLAFVYNHAGCETLFADSVAQGVKLFEAPALVVYVADWRYQLVGKITRAYQMMQMTLMYDESASAPTPTLAPTDRDGGEDGTVDGLNHALRVREPNLQDVVYILKLMLDKQQGHPLLLSEMKTWYSYGPALEIEEIDNANRAYCIVFKGGDAEYKAIIDDT